MRASSSVSASPVSQGPFAVDGLTILNRCTDCSRCLGVRTDTTTKSPHHKAPIGCVAEGPRQQRVSSQTGAGSRYPGSWVYLERHHRSKPLHARSAAVGRGPPKDPLAQRPDNPRVGSGLPDRRAIAATDSAGCQSYRAHRGGATFGSPNRWCRLPADTGPPPPVMHATSASLGVIIDLISVSFSACYDVRFL